MKSFASDYLCRPHPSVVAAVQEACTRESDGSYGDDSFTRYALSLFDGLFPMPAVHYVLTGTAANCLALETLLGPPFSAVICTETSHLNRHEAGATERSGHKLIPVFARDGKIDLNAVEDALKKRKDIHAAYPTVLSISNATELGTVYSQKELVEIDKFACVHDLRFHVDGARLAYAMVGSYEKEIRIPLPFAPHVSALSFGATKIGGMLGDAVVFPYASPEREDLAIRLQKQCGHLCARVHCIAAQFTALFTENLWLTLAAHANQKAQLLANGLLELGIALVYPVESNAVFVRLHPDVIAKLLTKTKFYVWDEREHTVRWMCSWNTTEYDVSELLILVKQCRG